ncbi:P-loop containing nucleoside triphosphate hydrolase protein [Dunaliella salina]|uniref:P-loop containing nucleoside triphosphate hydrolase protein n=1 Tax=Dunaliella salina TaxID=3046 RepID=A0ABQ7GZW9_DUNSA|nr:P-loop containing nucleoside triphosphate hydrolase protein [Dunaliella salina]|eukprot:KAF5840158.1 P-loop containing nucleoside triphosphate hydrolase protein [Dunaliella salina]
MGYVPPHKRGQGTGSPAPPPSSGGGGFGGMQRSGSYGSGMQHSQGSRRGPVEPVFLDWKPTDRILALSEEQKDEIKQRLNVTVEVPDGQSAPPPIESFIEMNLHPNIIQDIKLHKYETPTPIQTQGIPIALAGHDILGCAETGSGKTASFAIPMINHCLAQPPLRPGDGPIGLVLAPTRELAQQIEKEVRAFSITSAKSVRSCIVVGGVSMQEQRHDLRAGAEIKEVMARLPQRHQTLLFSATMPREIEALAQAYLNKPVTVKVGAVSTPTANVAQTLEKCDGDANKLDLLRKAKCDDVAAALCQERIPAAALHGGLGQSERECALSDFSAGRVKVLVATDVASRGLDIKGIGHVVNMDLPKTFEDYVHRIGRTGRAGLRGRATSLYGERDSYLVAQIKTAISEVEKGNQFAFASGKQARQEERQMAQQFKNNLKMSQSGVMQTGPAGVKVDDKYSFMANVQPASQQGAADAAWDD